MANEQESPAQRLHQTGGTGLNIHERGGLLPRHWEEIRNHFVNTPFSTPDGQIREAISDYASKVETGAYPDSGFHHRSHLGQQEWQAIAQCCANLKPRPKGISRRPMIFGHLQFTEKGNVQLYATLESLLPNYNELYHVDNPFSIENRINVLIGSLHAPSDIQWRGAWKRSVPQYSHKLIEVPDPWYPESGTPTLLESVSEVVHVDYRDLDSKGLDSVRAAFSLSGSPLDISSASPEIIRDYWRERLESDYAEEIKQFNDAEFILSNHDRPFYEAKKAYFLTWPQFKNPRNLHFDPFFMSDRRRLLKHIQSAYFYHFGGFPTICSTEYGCETHNPSGRDKFMTEHTFALKFHDQFPTALTLFGDENYEYNAPKLSYHRPV